MRIKVGSKVKVINEARATELDLRSRIGTVIGDDKSDKPYQVRFEDIDDWFWFYGSDLVLLEKPSIEKLKEMPIGTRITIDREDDNVFIKVEEDELEFYSIERGENLDRYDINDDLTVDEDWDNETTKIIKIEKPIEYETVYEYLEEEKKEMTIAEIEKELGYSVKIVKETKE